MIIGGHTFPKSICPKVNVIARQKFEPAYFEDAVHHVNDYIMRTVGVTVQNFWLYKLLYQWIAS